VVDWFNNNVFQSFEGVMDALHILRYVCNDWMQVLVALEATWAMWFNLYFQCCWCHANGLEDRLLLYMSVDICICRGWHWLLGCTYKAVAPFNMHTRLYLSVGVKNKIWTAHVAQVNGKEMCICICVHINMETYVNSRLWKMDPLNYWVMIFWSFLISFVGCNASLVC